ncbi:TetR/AcrR family transcriptional regulator [Kribbella turkmenica]|nr:TetR/AcrR family transcriptional regulator [Kribbella turkmenica]
MLYAYFGSKDGLFDAVYTAAVERYLADVGFDTTDLPEYAARVFDYFEKHPEHQRLNVWYRLERPEGAALAAIVAVNESRLADLRRAQRSGVVPGDFSPAELLALLQSVATSWSSMNPEYGAAVPGRAARRHAVVEAVRRLLAG